MKINTAIPEKDRTMTLEVDLSVEELEELVAPALLSNHNETLVCAEQIDLTIEELEEVIAPATLNHNETLVRAEEVDLTVEELEEVIAPIIVDGG